LGEASSLLFAVAEAPAYRECISMGGGDINLGALPGRPGSGCDSSIFMGVVLYFTTWEKMIGANGHRVSRQPQDNKDEDEGDLKGQVTE